MKRRKHVFNGMICLAFSLFTLFSAANLRAEGQSKFSKPFFGQITSIEMVDKLAVELGAISKGEVLVYNYEDAVKLAGHSCLAISGAYRLTQIALKRLYGEQIPVRGEIEVIFKGAVGDKINGPISQVVTLITGAAAENGFKGFGGKKFRRHNLLRFDQNSAIPTDAMCSVIFKRINTGKSVEIIYTTNMLPKLADIQEKVRFVLLGMVEDMFTLTES